MTMQERICQSLALQKQINGEIKTFEKDMEVIETIVTQWAKGFIDPFEALCKIIYAMSE